MIAYLIKNWKLLLDLVLVVGGIIAFTLFDPLKLFARAHLKSTASLVSNIRSIGELVTAEYYGETISSLHEAKIYEVPPDTLTAVYERCFFDLKYALVGEVLSQEKKRAKKPLALSKKIVKSDALQSLKIRYAKDEVYNYLFAFLAENNLSGNTAAFYNVAKKTLKNKVEEEVIAFLLGDLNDFIEKAAVPTPLTLPALSDYFTKLPPYFENIADYHYRLKGENITANRKERNYDIVFIGRGSVKAGFKFDQLDASNFHYDEELKVIYLYGLSPVILDADINPWFIPEQKIKGFELVEYSRKARFEDAAKVKKKCKEKLLAQAENAEILEESRKNGQIALQKFFSLVLDEPDLKVVLPRFPYEQHYQMIAADSVVTIREALLIDSLLRNSERNLDNTGQTGRLNGVPFTAKAVTNDRQFALFLDRLRSLTFVRKPYKFNLFSLEAASVLSHPLFINKNDYNRIVAVRDTLTYAEGTIRTGYTKDKPALFTYPDFVYDFNRVLTLIDEEISDIKAVRNDTLPISGTEMRALVLDTASAEMIAVSAINEDTIYNIRLKESVRNLRFADLQYPVCTIDMESGKRLLSADTAVWQQAINSALHCRYTSGARPGELKAIKQHTYTQLRDQWYVKPATDLLGTFREWASKL